MIVDAGTMGSVLGVWAHPDDEAYLMAGVMAMAVEAGQHVACVTATLGDAGETADPQRWPQAELHRVREDELARALAILDVRDHECLGLPDGHLSEVDAAAPVAALVAAIERVAPDTVITFGPDGMTGHPDHRTVSEWTTRALERAQVDAQLLFATKTDTWVDAFPGINDVVFPSGAPRTAEDQAWIVPLDDAILDRKLRALEAHASQTTGLIDACGRRRYADWVRLEAFRLPVWRRWDGSDRRAR